MNILHLPSDTGGNAWGLAQGERALGHTAHVLVAKSNYFSYPADEILFYDRARTLTEKAWCGLGRLSAFLRHRSKHDVFHFNFGSSLIHAPSYGLSLLELPFYPKHAKLVATYNGCDARQKTQCLQFDGQNVCKVCNIAACEHLLCDVRKAKSIAKMDHYAHAIFALNPDLLRFLPKRAQFLPYSLPLQTELSCPAWRPPSPTLRIVHAPTNRRIKGTEEILSAIEQLQAEYGASRIHFECIEGLSNSEAMKKYAEAHLVIDQLRAGWYGGLAVEAMRLGKPVVVYIREEDFVFVPNLMAKDCQEAFIMVRNNLVDTLRPYIENPSLLIPVREAALEYVRRWHDPVGVARKVIEIYEN